MISIIFVFYLFIFLTNQLILISSFASSIVRVVPDKKYTNIISATSSVQRTVRPTFSKHHINHFSKVAVHKLAGSMSDEPSYKQSSKVSSDSKIFDSNGEIHSGLNDIISEYDTFLIDQWGVLHDGTKPYDGVFEALKELHSLDKKMILLSNSSKRMNSSVRGLQKLGFDVNMFAGIVTSGELGWNALKDRSEELLSDINLKLDTPSDPLKVFVIGNGDDDLEYVKSCNCIPSSPETADMVIARGTFAVLCDERLDASESRIFPSSGDLMSNIEPWLHRCASRKLPMVVTNPDNLRPGGNDPMPGVIAKMYGSMNDKVRIKYYGKPHDVVYKQCQQILTSKGYEFNPSRVCGVGDSLEHDILGAVSAGLGSVWIMNGVHSGDLNTKEGSDITPSTGDIQRTLLKYEIAPKYMIPSFKL